MTMIEERAPLVAGQAPAGREEEDAGLVARVRAGDLSAYDELVGRHRPWLLRRCALLLGNDGHLAEDIAQDTLFRLLGAIRRDDRPLRVGAWLAVVSRHACIDEHRKRRADLPGVLPEKRVDPEEPIALEAPLAAAWASLPGRHREVLYLREVIGFPYTEIADTLDLSVSAVETLLFRARNALRREYARAGGGSVSFGALGAGLRRLDFTGVAGLPAAPAAPETAGVVSGTDPGSRLTDPGSTSAGTTAGEGQPTVIDLADRIRRAPTRAFEPLTSLMDTLRAAGTLGTGLLSGATAAVLSVVPIVPSLVTPVVSSVQPVVTGTQAAAGDVVNPVAAPVQKASAEGVLNGLLTEGSAVPLTPTLSGPLRRLWPGLAAVLRDWERLGEEIGDRFDGRVSASWSSAQEVRGRFEDGASSRWSEAKEHFEQRASSVDQGRQQRGAEGSSGELGIPPFRGGMVYEE